MCATLLDFPSHMSTGFFTAPLRIFLICACAHSEDSVGHSWARTPQIFRAKGAGGSTTLLQLDPEACGVFS